MFAHSWFGLGKFRTNPDVKRGFTPPKTFIQLIHQQQTCHLQTVVEKNNDQAFMVLKMQNANLNQ